MSSNIFSRFRCNIIKWFGDHLHHIVSCRRYLKYMQMVPTPSHTLELFNVSLEEGSVTDDIGGKQGSASHSLWEFWGLSGVGGRE